MRDAEAPRDAWRTGRMPPSDGRAVVVVSEPREHVRLITLSRPDSLNALNAPMVEALGEALADAERDPHCRVVVITGAGRGFCAGLDLSGYGVLPGWEDTGDLYQDLAFQRATASLVQMIRRMPKPVIAKVNGPAAGFGLALVCVADLRVASSAAVFTTAFIRVGATGCDIGVSWALPRLVGAGRAHELILTARRFDAEEALRIGLLADAVPPEELDSRVDGLIDSLLAATPMGLDLTKQGMWLALEVPSLDAAIEIENRQQILASRTSDRDEALAATREGRPARYLFR